MSAGGYLRPLNAKQKEWAFRNSVEHFAYRLYILIEKCARDSN